MLTPHLKSSNPWESRPGSKQGKHVMAGVAWLCSPVTARFLGRWIRIDPLLSFAQVIDTLSSKPPALTSYLAGLLRDGVLEAAMRKASEVPTDSSLGRKFPDRARKVKFLSPSIKTTVACRVNPALAEHVRQQQTNDEYADDFKLEGDWMNEFLQVAGGISMNDAKIPVQHDGAGFEHPFADVFVAQAHAQGDLLHRLTLQEIKDKAYQLFTWPYEDEGGRSMSTRLAWIQTDKHHRH